MSAPSSGSSRLAQALLWLRWSWRDLKAHWLQVLAIAMVIALGTGSYAGLSSVTRWRRSATDAGYASLRMYDLRVSVAQKALAPAGALASAARSIPDSSRITAAQERLVSDVQVDASHDGQTIIVPGLLYGMDVKQAAPVNALYPDRGRALAATDDGAPVAMLERNFAKHYELPDEGNVLLGGGRELHYVGQALTPEYFLVTTERGGLMAEANFAAVFTSLTTAQAMSGAPGMVNDLVITLQPGSDVAAMQKELQDAFAARLPNLGVNVTTREDDASFRLNDRDIDGDQQIYDIFAVLIFAGAIGAAFNLSARLVEAQRREIGIAMVLGVSPLKIAVRPMLVGAEIAVMGVIFGVGVGFVIGDALMSLVRKLMPLPRWDTPFQLGLFAGVATLGFLLPLLATAWPVWRAVRVTPIEAIRPPYRAAKGAGLAPFLRWLRLPGTTLSQTPVRNVVRSPRRSLLTCLGIAAALAALVAFVGMIDSFVGTTDRGEAEIVGKNPERLDITLAGFMPQASPAVQSLLRDPLLAQAEPGALVQGRVSRGDSQLDVQVEFINLDSAIWSPTLLSGRRDRQTSGIYLSELAAKNLGVSTGDRVTLHHPQIGANGSIALVDTDLPVLGVHPHPFRFVAYMDVNQLSILGPGQLTNVLMAVPASGASQNEVKRSLFAVPAVAAVSHVGDVATAIRDLLDEFVVVLRVVEIAMLLIALLIAFNSASINMDERLREHATMFAFGVPVGTVLRMAVIENLLIGLISTAGGVAGGWALLQLIVATRVADTMPDIYIKAVLSQQTLAIAVALGVVLVSLAPLLGWRRLTRLDVPSALKLVE